MGIFEGRGASRHLADTLAGATRVLIVHLDDAYESCGAKAVVDNACAGRTVATFAGFPTNPRIEDALRGVEVARGFEPEVVLAVGGGSVMDMAKVLALFATHPASDLVAIATGQESPQNDALPIVAVPTTAGTGSEATQFAVVYYEGKKYSLAHPSLLPSAALVEPAFCDALPRSVTACSGLDVICQAIEALWCVNATEASDAEAERALQLAWHNLPTAVHSGSAAARDAMCLAATAAGRAINITRTTAPHALSYWLTSNRDVPHGHAVALTLAGVLQFNALVTAEDVMDPRGVDYVKGKIARIVEIVDCDSAAEAASQFDGLVKQIGLQDRLSKVGVLQSDVAVMAESVNVQRLKNNPRRMTREDIIGLLEALL